MLGESRLCCWDDDVVVGLSCRSRVSSDESPCGISTGFDGDTRDNMTVAVSQLIENLCSTVDPTPTLHFKHCTMRMQVRHTT